MKESKLVTILRMKNRLFRGKKVTILDVFFRLLFSFDIPTSVKIGKGTKLPHFGLGVVIHPKVIIGENCKIFQQATIGYRNGDGPPIIGDNVYIGTGAKILGKIKIGDNTKIGANAVVLKDIPSNATVVGIPGKVINSK